MDEFFKMKEGHIEEAFRYSLEDLEETMKHADESLKNIRESLKKDVNERIFSQMKSDCADAMKHHHTHNGKFDFDDFFKHHIVCHDQYYTAMHVMDLIKPKMEMYSYLAFGSQPRITSVQKLVALITGVYLSVFLDFAREKLSEDVRADGEK